MQLHAETHAHTHTYTHTHTNATVFTQRNRCGYCEPANGKQNICLITPTRKGKALLYETTDGAEGREGTSLSPVEC